MLPNAKNVWLWVAVGTMGALRPFDIKSAMGG
jgi:hypothetical protein